MTRQDKEDKENKGKGRGKESATEKALRKAAEPSTEGNVDNTNLGSSTAGTSSTSGENDNYPANSRGASDDVRTEDIQKPTGKTSKAVTTDAGGPAELTESSSDTSAITGTKEEKGPQSKGTTTIDRGLHNEEVEGKERDNVSGEETQS